MIFMKTTELINFSLIEYIGFKCITIHMFSTNSDSYFGKVSLQIHIGSILYLC